MLFGEKVAYPREGKGDYMFHFSLPLTFAREFCTSLPSNGSCSQGDFQEPALHTDYRIVAREPILSSFYVLLLSKAVCSA